MKTSYRPDLKAHVSLDEQNKVRHIRHSQEYWLSEQKAPRLSADDYLNEMAETLQIPKKELKNLHKEVSFLEPLRQGIEYHFSEEKHFFDSTTIGYYQTYMNVPVWRRGLSVKIKQHPNRIVSSTNNSEDDIHGKLPDAESIEQYKKIFRQAIAQKSAIEAGLGTEGGRGRNRIVRPQGDQCKSSPRNGKIQEGKGFPRR